MSDQAGSPYSRIDPALNAWADQRGVLVDTAFRDEDARIIWLGKMGFDRVQIGPLLPTDVTRAEVIAYFVRATPKPGENPTELAEFKGAADELPHLLDLALDQGLAWLGKTRADIVELQTEDLW